MTNTESRIAIELEELALGDDAPAQRSAEEQITEDDIRELAIYGFDSDKQTLVGLGPVERARRSRKAAEIPDSQRAPQSESPGPFIADDDEIPASWRRRRPGPWAVAAPALLIVAIVAVVGLRGLAPDASHAPAASQPTVAVLAQPLQDEPQTPAESVRPPEQAPQPAESVRPPEQAPQPAESVRPPEQAPPPAERVARVENASLQKPTVRTERARVTVPVVSAALPVELPELAPPSVVDLSSSADANVGAINVTSNPPANVVVDGRPVGKARVVKVPAGLHTVVFIHPLYGRQSLRVNVGSGATTSASADF
jgi:hypothetical protein